MIFIFSSFTFREWGGSSRWEPRRIESRGADRSHHLPFPRTIEREYTRSTRWAKVRHPHRHPGEASTPLLPHTTSLCVSCTLRNPVAVWPYGWHLHNRAPPCPRGNPWSSGHTGNTITHAARQAATRYRKAEIDNAGGPPAPYPNLDTRPAPAPGSSRQDPALPSVSPPFIRVSSSFHFLLLAFPFRSNFDERNYGNHDNPFLVNFLPIECPTKDKKLLRFITCFFADFLLLVCTSLEFKSRKEIIRINDPFLVNFFSPPKRQKLLRLFLLIIQPSDRNSGYFSGDLRDIRTKNSFFLDDWNLNKYRWQIINNSSRDNYSIINCVRVYIILNNFIAIDSTSQPVSSPILEPDRNEHRCILVPIAVFHDRS